MASAPKLDIEKLYREHGYLVLRRAGQILNDDEEAREALQDIFVALASRPGQFAGGSSIATYLYRRTRSPACSAVRARRSARGWLDSTGRSSRGTRDPRSADGHDRWPGLSER
jgi:RNA polymerase sigma-70 factor (ECF subfamily)